MRNGISVIIPTYNREKFIAEAIQSVLDQKFDGKIEIIISDDGSTDRTLPLVESFGNKVLLLYKCKSCKNQGVSGTRNRGLQIATQPYICFLDSDDLYLQGHLQKMVSKMEDKPASGFVFCRSLDLKEENGIRLFKPWTHGRIFKKDISNPSIFRSHVVNTNCFLFRKEVFETVGTFNEAYTNFEDIDLWMRISEKYRGTFSNHFGAVYRTNHGGTQLTKNSYDEKKIACLCKIQKDALSRYYELNLKDRNRLFELKHLLLHCQYQNNKLKYGIKYFNLILSDPGNFIQRIIPFFFMTFEKRKNRKWRDLQNFLS